jgi:hypothetical protein
MLEEKLKKEEDEEGKKGKALKLFSVTGRGGQ